MHEELPRQLCIDQTNLKVVRFKSGQMQDISYPRKETVNIEIVILRHQDNMEKLILKEKG